MDREERNVLQKISEEVNKVIDNVCQKYNIDRGYFEFILKVNVLDEDFRKIVQIDLINEENEYHCCLFCGEFARYYDRKFQGYICSKCFKNLNEEI